MASTCLPTRTVMESELDAYMNYVRVSLAIAVIKRKAEGVTGLQHAQELQRQIRDEQRVWKEDYLRLKDELLQVKQSQILANLDRILVTEPDTITSTPFTKALGDGASGSSSMVDGCCRSICFESADLRNREFLQSVATMRQLDISSVALQSESSVQVIAESVIKSLSSIRGSLVRDRCSSEEETSMRLQLTGLADVGIAEADMSNVLNSQQKRQTQC